MADAHIINIREPLWWWLTWKAYSFPMPWDAPVTTKAGRNKWVLKASMSRHILLLLPYTRGSQCCSEREASAGRPMTGLFLCWHEPIPVSLCPDRMYSPFFGSDKPSEQEHLVYWLQSTPNPSTKTPSPQLKTQNKTNDNNSTTSYNKLRGRPLFLNCFFSPWNAFESFWFFGF